MIAADAHHHRPTEGESMKAIRVGLTALTLVVAASAAQAQISDNVIKIGVLSDMSSLYTDLAGAGSVAAARMAVEDSGIEKRGVKVEIVSADHQNKPDVASAIARKWYDTDKVDVIVDVPNSGVALAVNQITRDKGKAFLVSGAASSDLTGKACSPNTADWTYDTWMLANGTGSAIVKTGGRSRYLITAGYAFGHALERDTRPRATKSGGKSLGKARHPLTCPRVSVVLLHATPAKTDDGTKVVAKMKELPTEDPLFGKGRVRQDGRKVHQAYLVEVKKPAESKAPYDYYKIRATIPADQAFRPEKDGGCSLVK